MNLNAAYAILAVFLLGLPGCLDPGQEKAVPEGNSSTGDGTGGSSAQTSTPPVGNPSVPDAAVPLDAAFSDCKEWSNLVAGPVEVFSGPLPEGWPRGTLPVSSLLMQFLECNRVSWGSYERGPLHILLEFTEDMDPPASCREGDISRTHMLRALWIDDAEIGAWLEQTYGIPVIVAEFHVAVTADGLEETWAWSEPGGTPSEIHFQDPPPADTAPVPYTHRMYWFNDTSLSYMDFAEHSSVDDAASPAAYGLLQPPTQFAAMTGQSVYSGGVDHGDHANVAVSIFHFGDTECKTPKPF